jgi:ribosomal protein L16 Arg81 hydroxylase
MSKDLDREMALGLAHLIAPTDVAVFLSEYWEQRPLLNVRDDHLYYSDLFSLEAAEEIITTSHRHFSAVRIVKDGHDLPIDSIVPLDQDRLYVEHTYEAYRRGSTIVFQFLHERWPALQDLCSQLSSEFGIGFQVNAYLTPHNAQGLGVHYDTHDVFVAQVEGRKHWRLFESSLRLPLPSQPYQKGVHAAAAPMQEFDLRAGDLLYLPRGVVHEALATDSSSLHLTIGVHHVTWTNIIQTAVEEAAEQNIAFRKSLPFGFHTGDIEELETYLRQLMRTLVADVAYVSAVENARRSAELTSAPQLRGHLRDLDVVPYVTTNTPVSRRSGLQWRLYRLDGEICLQFHGKEIGFPRYAEADLRHLAEVEGSFTAATLPGRLDEPGRLTLVRRLLREGFLTFSLSATYPAGG